MPKFAGADIMANIQATDVFGFPKLHIRVKLFSSKALTQRTHALRWKPESPQVAELQNRLLPAGNHPDIIVVAFLMLIEFAYVLMAVAVPDTAYNIVEAWNICSGHQLPLTGVVFSGKFSLGPFWIYLIAPFACTRNPLLTVGLVVALFSALKYPLAYTVARRLVSRDFAILWMPLLSILSWPSTLITYSHTSALLTLLLLSVALLVAFGGTRVVLSGFLFGLVTSLAINSHPSAFPFVVLALIPLYLARQAGRLTATIVLGLTGAAIPFLPLLFALLQSPEVAQRNSEILEVLRADGLRSVPHYLWQMATGPIASVVPVVSQSGVPAAVMWGLYALLYLLGLYGSAKLILDKNRSPLMVCAFLGLTGLVILFALAVTSIRSYFPYYMLLVTALPFSALLAFSLVGLKGWLRSVVLLVAMSLVAIPLIAHVHAIQRASYRIPIEEQYDAQRVTLAFPDLPYYFWASVRHFPEIASLACESDPGRLHGYLPLQLNDALGLPTRACGTLDSEAGAHWLTIPRPIWKAIGRTPVKETAGQGLFDALAVSPDADRPIIATTYPPYTKANPVVQRTLTISAPRDALLFLSNLYYFTPLKITQLEVSDGEAEIRYQDEYALILECTSCHDNKVEWKITVNAGEASPLDLVAF